MINLAYVVGGLSVGLALAFCPYWCRMSAATAAWLLWSLIGVVAGSPTISNSRAVVVVIAVILLSWLMVRNARREIAEKEEASR